MHLVPGDLSVPATIIGYRTGCTKMLPFWPLLKSSNKTSAAQINSTTNAHRLKELMSETKSRSEAQQVGARQALTKVCPPGQR